MTVVEPQPVEVHIGILPQAKFSLSITTLPKYYLTEIRPDRQQKVVILGRSASKGMTGAVGVRYNRYR